MDWPESGKDSFARTIGDRVRELRIRRGYRSARELAEAIPNARLTAKVINNIEIGRKLDLTVVELLELSRALDVAPQLLLVHYHRPYDRTETPGVSGGIATMSGVEFVEWLSLPFEGHPILMNLEGGEPEEAGALLALRGYEMQRRFAEHQLQQLRLRCGSTSSFRVSMIFRFCGVELPKLRQSCGVWPAFCVLAVSSSRTTTLTTN